LFALLVGTFLVIVALIQIGILRFAYLRRARAGTDQLRLRRRT
jgi:hypothetical protein